MKSCPIHHQQGFRGLIPILLLTSASPALAANASTAAQQYYLCAGAAGQASQILARSDPQAAENLALKARSLLETGVALEVRRQVNQDEAVAAMKAFFKGREALYRSDPAQATKDLAACRARGILPPAREKPAIGSATPATTRAGDAAFRRFLLGPWGRMKGGNFDSEMIGFSGFRPGGAKFTRRSCPTGGLASPTDMLSHEIWFEERAGGEFGVIRANGDPGEVTQLWTRLTFLDHPDASTWRYSFYNKFLMETVTLILKKQGPDQILHEVEVPNVRRTGSQELYGRCRRR